jgi:oligoribonuclease
LHRVLVWMDLEMTGLDPDKDVIVEIATLITDDELLVIEEGPNLVIHQPDDK